MLTLEQDSLRESFIDAFGALFPANEWPEGKLESLLATVQYRSMDAGTVIMREGQVCGSVPFVLEGAIRIFKMGETGREITLYRLERGQSCILSAGCGRGIASFPATVVAEKHTKAAFMPSEMVHKMFSDGPSFRDYVLEQYSRRMAETIELVEEIAFRKVDERLAAWLNECGGKAGVVEATHQELADHVGTSREVISRILKDWEERGLLEMSRKSLQLLSGFETLIM